jgi:hypothetical protein
VAVVRGSRAHPRSASFRPAPPPPPPQVASLPADDPAAAAAQARLASLPAAVRRLGELQLERRLADRRRGAERSAAFSWVRCRQVPLS